MNEQLFFKGTLHLTKIILRQQRVKMFAWIVGLVVVTLAAAYSYPTVYTDDASKQAFALTMENPAMVAMLGPGYELEDYFVTVGTEFAGKMLLFSIITIAVMNILLVGSSTRIDEEAGRIEVIRSLPVGRLAYLAASSIVVVTANVLIGLLISLGLALFNIDGISFESSLLYGCILGSGGLIFASITALLAQVSDTSRGTTGLSFGVLIIAYLVRAVGDVSHEGLSLFSPLGWLVRTNVFIDNEWWPVITSCIGAIIFSIIAFYLNSIRDLDSGFLPTIKGRTHASAFLQTTFGLTFRLQSIKIIAWFIGIFAFGASFGSVLGDMETYFQDIEIIEMVLSQTGNLSMANQFLSFIMSIMTLISSIPVIMTVLKLKSEEHNHRTENLYSRAVSRNSVLGSYIILAIMESIILQILFALGLWIASVATAGDILSFTTTMKSAIIYLPAIWVMVGLAVLLHGLVPKLTSFIWLYVTFCFVVVYLGGLLKFPKWLMNLSIFEIVPKIPGEEMEFLPILILTIVAIIFIILGFIGYNKRDVEV